MNKRVLKLQGRRVAGTYGRTAKKRQKRIANKAGRKLSLMIEEGYI